MKLWQIFTYTMNCVNCVNYVQVKNIHLQTEFPRSVVNPVSLTACLIPDTC